jgi:dipeptidyl aminopeptidase/acylaminoacyl peptidase
MNQYLTSRGFIVLSVNYRCGIGYGLDFRQCAHEGATGAAEYNDVLAAAKYLQSRPDVDAKRIGLWGGSYGGYLTALALARNSDIFAAGVDLHGVHDWNLEDNASDWKRGDNATQDAIGKLALASSPLADISHWHSPILLIHGDNDPSVAYAQTPILADALRARNSTLPKNQQVDVEELIFPDEVHEFILHKDWLAAYTAAAQFFELTLKP